MWNALLNAIESCVNRLSDSDWAWWPLVSWRPPQNVLMGVRFCVQYGAFCAAMCYLIIFSMLLLVLTWLQYSQYAEYYQRLNITFAMLLIYHGSRLFMHLGLWLFAGVLVYSLLVGSIFVSFWNRRAVRLIRSGGINPMIAPADNVCPPPPSSQAV